MESASRHFIKFQEQILKSSDSKMKNLILLTIPLVFGKCTECQPLWLNSFTVARPRVNRTVILSEIILNFINKYLNENEKFVSLILKLSVGVNEADFFYDTSSILRKVEFPHVILNELTNATYENRNAFNLIVVDDISVLSWVDFFSYDIKLKTLIDIPFHFFSIKETL